jgi:hypothetical protein
MIPTTHRYIAVSKIPTTAGGLTSYAHALIAGLTGNALVPNPNPSVATLTDLLGKYETAETATKARTAGTIGARNTAKAALIQGLRAVRTNLQLLADASPDNAEAIITSTSLTVRKTAARSKAPFAVVQGPISGSAHLTAKSTGPRAAYDWEWSGDAGKTWVQATSTTQARTTITGLPVGTSVQFRFRSVTPKGQSDWCQPVSLLVK